MCKQTQSSQATHPEQHRNTGKKINTPLAVRLHQKNHNDDETASGQRSIQRVGQRCVQAPPRVDTTRGPAPGPPGPIEPSLCRQRARRASGGHSQRNAAHPAERRKKRLSVLTRLCGTASIASASRRIKKKMVVLACVSRQLKPSVPVRFAFIRYPRNPYTRCCAIRCGCVK